MFNTVLSSSAFCGCEDGCSECGLGGQQECEECGAKTDTTPTRIGASTFAICDDCTARWAARADAEQDRRRFGDDTFVVRAGR